MNAPDLTNLNEPGRLERWESALDGPLLAAAALFLLCYGTPILYPGLPGWAHLACTWTQIAVWLLFAVDLTVRLSLAPDRRRFLTRNWFDAVAVALPALRPVAALINVLNRSLRAGRSALVFGGGMAAVAVTTSAVIIAVGALSVLAAERGQSDANIETIGDALWWAMTTVTTVGYGDHYPVTTGGRLTAAGLMVAGVALLGVVTATLSSWFVDRVSEQDEDQAASAHAELLGELRALRREVAELRERGSPV